MNLIILSSFLVVFITVQAEDCFNYDIPLKDNVMLKDVQDECVKKVETDKADYVSCIECKLGLVEGEKKVPNFERYKEHMTKMIKDEKDKDIILKAVDDCKASEYTGDNKEEKFVMCWRKKFIAVCGKDPRVSNPRGLH
uniref:Uncharacterized protein n=1 Tax=Strigamia maritima TaxID=126957 RepID=T1JF72_STRMM